MRRVFDMSHTIENRVQQSLSPFLPCCLGQVVATLPQYYFFNLVYIFCRAQDQLSADMYSFVAKEIDYANYFQTVRAHRGKTSESLYRLLWWRQQRKVGIRKGPSDCMKASVEEVRGRVGSTLLVQSLGEFCPPCVDLFQHLSLKQNPVPEDYHSLVKW